MVKDDLFFKNIEQNPISFMFSHMKLYVHVCSLDGVWKYMKSL